MTFDLPARCDMPNVLDKVEKAIREESHSERLTSDCSALSTFQWRSFRVKALAWSRGMSECFPTVCYLPNNLGSVRLYSDRIVYEVTLPSCSLKRKACTLSSDAEDESLSPVYKSTTCEINKV